MVGAQWEAGMGLIVFFAISAAVILVVGRIGDWFDAKTGFVLGAIITGLLLILYFHAAKEAATSMHPHQPLQHVSMSGTADRV
jgi:MFS family permease